jgi:hypothetical protein
MGAIVAITRSFFGGVAVGGGVGAAGPAAVSCFEHAASRKMPMEMEAGAKGLRDLNDLRDVRSLRGLKGLVDAVDIVDFCGRVFPSRRLLI